MIRPPKSSVPLAVLSVIALALLFGRATGSDGEGASPVAEPVVRDRAAAAPRADVPRADAPRADAPRTDAPKIASIERPRHAAEPAVVDIFSGRSWTPPPAPAPVVAPAPPPPPMAPALPYTYMGRVEAADEKTVVYLARGDHVVPASEGDLLDQVYRIESLNEDQIVFVFVPLGQKQVLRIEGGAK